MSTGIVLCGRSLPVVWEERLIVRGKGAFCSRKTTEIVARVAIFARGKSVVFRPIVDVQEKGSIVEGPAGR